MSQLQRTYKSLFTVVVHNLNASLGYGFFGYQLGVFNTFQEHLSRVFGWSADEKAINVGLITSMMALGALIGSAISGKWANAIGRRRGMLVTNVVCFIGIALTMFVNLPIMLLGRIITGIGAGLHSALEPIYINEISPVSLRGSMGFVGETVFAFGILSSFLLGLGLSDPSHVESNYWRFMFLFAGAPLIMQTLNFFIWSRFEPPYFDVCVKSNEHRARETITRLYKQEHVDAQMEFLKRQKVEESVRGVTYKELVSPRYRKQLFVGCLLHFMQQASGVNAITFYSNKIFSDGDPAKEASLEVTILTIILGISEFVATFGAMFIVERSGRKRLMILGVLSLLICLVTLSLSFFIGLALLPKIFLNIFMISYGISLGPVTWVYSAEVLPDKGVGIATLVNWAATAAVAQVVPVMLESIQPQGTFLVFLACLLVCFGLVICVMKETKNLNALDIQRLFYHPRDKTVYPEPEVMDQKFSSESETGLRATTETNAILSIDPPTM
eukprot:TRINITY_DN9465_c0_g1_i3.p1 TRINITY_DN9465_c0_g1~~TRINITY_DN9465_c0_g1_i3.p1  ORF type:complete len:500 (-),score=104.50 TRINITY_DN9465_c0_g1_i3:291-1790(-)